MTNKEILQKAIDTYGAESQIDMAIEECAELIQAICKLKRNIQASTRCKDEKSRFEKLEVEGLRNIENLIEEIADVEIMTTQLKMILGCAREVLCTKQAKIDRLAERLEANT